MRRSLALASVSVVLLAAPVLALPAREDPPLVLVQDVAAQRLHLRTQVRAAAVLVVGPRSLPPIPIQGIELHVVPDLVVPLGVLKAAETLSLPVPPGATGLGAQAVALDLETPLLVASDAVFLQDQDLVESSFQAALSAQPGPPIQYRLGASLSAPSSGYVFRLDAVDTDAVDKGETSTHVYLRLIAPGPGQIVQPVITRHTVDVLLGSAIGEEVHVSLAREVRGVPGPAVYRRMAVLKVPPTIQ